MKRAYFFWLLSIILMLIGAACGKGGTQTPQNVQNSTSQTSRSTLPDTAYSNWYTPLSYISDTLSAVHKFYTNIPASAITQNILDQDTVIVFGKTDGYNPVLYPTNLVSQLPISVTFEDNTILYTDRWTATVTPGKIQINFVDDHNFSSGLYYAHKFRYLIRPRNVNSIGMTPRARDIK